MRTTAGVLDTGSFVLERIREQPRRKRETDDLALTARAAYVAAGGRSPTGGEWIWNAHRVTWVRDDCVVKVSRSTYGEMALRRDLMMRTHLHVHPPSPAWRDHVADTLGEYYSEDRLAVVEERLPGLPLLGLMHDKAVMARVRGALAELRSATAHEVRADDRLVAWFHGPAARVTALLRRRGYAVAADAISKWAADMAASLEGKACRVVLVHGDLWPGNILLRRDNAPGLIDWDQASFHDAALHDVLHLALYPLCYEQRVDLGLLVTRLRNDSGTDGAARAILAASGLDEVLDDVLVAERDALVWYWLRHVDRMIQEPGHANNPRWFKNNIVAVATALIMGDER